MKTTFHRLVIFACAILCSQLPAAKPATPLSLADYARANTITILAISNEGTIPPLPASDQTNNLSRGEKILTLSGKGLTDINGISTLQVVDDGKTVPLSKVKGLHLFLNKNELSSLPAELFTMQNVIFLYLEHNRLDAIPPGIARMKYLFGMYWTNNNISSIPPEVFEMTQLKKIQVSKNKLTELPEAIGNLTRTVHFNFSSNKISKVPDSMAKLTRLRVCDLSDNNITELPEAFGKVKIFHQLRVKNNPLTTLPAGFANMPGTIDITGTQIDVSKLPEGLRKRISTKKHASKGTRTTVDKESPSHMEKHEKTLKETARPDSK